jgi:hypothetical protein
MWAAVDASVLGARTGRGLWSDDFCRVTGLPSDDLTFGCGLCSDDFWRAGRGLLSVDFVESLRSAVGPEVRRSARTRSRAGAHSVRGFTERRRDGHASELGSRSLVIWFIRLPIGVREALARSAASHSLTAALVCLDDGE